MNLWDCANPPLAPWQSPEPEAMAYHTPVMPDEVADLLRPAPGMLILDGTLGGGGHTNLLLEAGADVIGLDRDADAIAEVTERLAAHSRHLRTAQANFAEVGSVLDGMGVANVGGALLDLGVSSHQLDEGARGFAFMKNGPLDMRMDRRQTLTAADLVNHASFEELARIFREYGEEPKAARIASRLVAVRAKKPLETTFDLTAAIESVIHRTGPRQPGTKVFQALRIAVNDELGSLRLGLDAISQRLAPGARFAVITFHSLEDRIVKHYFRERSAEWIDRPEWPEPRQNPLHTFKLISPRPMVASPTETATNPRSRSAKLRVVEKL